MFNKDELKKELSGNASKSYFAPFITCFVLLKRVYKMSRLIKKCNKSTSDLKNNCYVYLADNYSRLEQGVSDDAHKLFYAKSMSAAAFRSRYLFAFYRYLKNNPCPESQQELTRFFEAVNSFDDYPDLWDEVNLLTYYRCALSLVIFDIFEGLLKHGPGTEDEKNLREMFCAYDAVQSFDEKSILLSHPVEKTLLNDPACLYDKLSDATKASYRRNLEKKAGEKKTSTLNLAKEIVAVCSGETDYTRRHIGVYLCDRAVLGNSYIVLLVFLSILFTVLLCLVHPFFVVTFFGVFTSTRLLLDKIFHKFARPFTLPCLELCEIPEKHGVMVVITSLLTGKQSDDELFSRLEMLYFLCREKNVCFGLLCDLCDSDNEFDDNDREVFEKANDRVRFLREKYGGLFYLFLRQREYSSSERRYIAPERKRGAVSSLVSFLCNKNDGFCSCSIKPSHEECDNIKYVFTLDADTNMEFDCLKRAVGIMMHPQNIPVYNKEKNAVIRGYGIIQPAVVTTPSACNKNFFTSVLCGHGGVSCYQTGIVDGSMPFFERSIFVGKGMFDKNVFYEALCADNAFKNESVLSHDAPEGARLRCAHVSSITLTDSFPSNELSYYKRLHRWIRGDIQNIPFLFKSVKTRNGKRIKNGIGAASRLFIFENVKNALLDVFTLVALFCSNFFSEPTQVMIITVSLSAYFLPFVYSVLSTFKKTILHNYRRLFFSRGIYSGIVCDFLLCTFKISALAKTACVSIDATIRSLFRMFVSKRGLLEWTTSAQNDLEKNDGLLGYVKKNIASAFLGVLLYVNTDNSFLRLIGLLWLFMPYFSYVFCKEKDKEAPVSKIESERLLGYCHKMWQFFEQNVTQNTNFLPPDNVSFKNGEKICNMTSPTNIGLYLVSVCVCEKLGFLSWHDVCQKLEETLESVKKLPKYKGLLYNWYDIYKLEPMKPMYVSSVDEGNFIACLYAVKGALWEYETTERVKNLINTVTRLISQSELSFMYNKKRELFYIGFTVTDTGVVFDKNCYDMLISEARILSFVAISQRLVDVNHYRKLSRRFVEGCGYLGLASWSGTMFEYFMPELFFKSEKSTLLYEALSFALHFSKKTYAKEGLVNVYGISESCYNEIDDDGNYKYYAFGVQKLAVDVFDKRLVISPYSSFLALGFCDYKGLENLENIKKLGGFGKYGFYESIDFDNKNPDGSLGVVRCFMSHHIGMSILSCANRMFQSAVCRWFLQDKDNLAFYSFTKEQIPYCAYIKKNAKKHYELFFRIKQANAKQKKMPVVKNAKLVCNSLEAAVSQKGMQFLYDKIEIFKSNTNNYGIKATLSLSGREFDVIEGAAMTCQSSYISFVKYPTTEGGKKYKTNLSVTLEKNTADIVRIKLAVEPQFKGEEQKIKCSFTFAPFLNVRNEGDCPLFDNSKGYELSVNDNNTLKYHNKKSGIYMNCSLYAKENSKTLVQSFVENENTCVLKAESVKVKDIFECELIISLSYDEKCAVMGGIRSRERDFERAARLLDEQKNMLYGTKKNEKKQGVLGASIVKEKEVKPEYPINTQHSEYKLLCGKKFASVILKDGLGFSFCGDAREGEVSRYDEREGRILCSEGVYFGVWGEFDLIKNAKEIKNFPYMVQYEGMYFKEAYRMTVFVSANMPYKAVVVETISQSPLSFCVTPSQKFNSKHEISGGVLFFSSEEKIEQKGFLTGVCIAGDTAVCQAELSCFENKISAFFDFDNQETQRLKKYIFALGMTDSIDKAYLYQSTIAGGYDEMLKASARLVSRLYINRQKIPSRLFQILSQGFVIPEENLNLRCLVNTKSPIRAFDSLLLVYTKSGLKTERILEGFMRNEEDITARLLLYVSLCEHTRLYEENELCENIIDKKCLYRIAAENIIDMAKQIKNSKDDFIRKLYFYTLDRVMCLCRNLQDMPAYYKLCEIKKMFF